MSFRGQLCHIPLPLNSAASDEKSVINFNVAPLIYNVSFLSDAFQIFSQCRPLWFSYMQFMWLFGSIKFCFVLIKFGKFSHRIVFLKKLEGGNHFFYRFLWLPDTLGVLNAVPQVSESLMTFLIIQVGSFLLIHPQNYWFFFLLPS